MNTEILLDDVCVEEILVRNEAILALKQQEDALLLQARQYTAYATWIQEVLDYIYVHSLSANQENLQERYDAIASYRKKANACTKKAQQMREEKDFLQESLTFFLARRYNLDPIQERWVLSLEKKVLWKDSQKDAQ